MDTPLPDLPGTAAASNNALGALSQVIYASESFEEVYQAIVTTAVRIIDGCDHASIMQRGRDGQFQTVASSDDIARSIDKLEQLHREGPCLDAIVEDVPQFENDLADPTTQWPALAEQVVR
jgi:GAF domain-containing protein